MNIIINGNCLEELKKLKDNSIDLIFADPPYWMRVEGNLERPTGEDFDGCNDDWDNQFSSNEDYKLFTKRWLKECYRVLSANGSIWVIGGMQCIYTIGGIMQDLGYWFINDVVWHKSNPTPNFKGTRLTNSQETLIWATKSKKSKYTFNYKTAKELNNQIPGFENGDRKQLGSVWQIPVCSGGERIKNIDGNKLHSTQKPEELLYRIIAISSKKGDLVLDPFGGTMTTAAVAKRLGRNYITIEQSLEYCEYGKKRISNITYINDDISLAVFDIKPIKATMQEMIRSGYFTVGELFYLKNTTATLNEQGKLEYQGKVYDMHSLAGHIKSGSGRLNGFEYWHVLRDDNKVLIKEIREQYRATLNYL